MATHDQAHFEGAYAGQAPWDIGKPQPAFVEAANRVVGAVLDAGCGTGEHALFFASRGHRVTGIDFLSEPINRAQRKARERALSVNFLVMDALALTELSEVFDTAIDSGLFHVFSDDDRSRYVAGLTTVVKPGGRLLLFAFSDEEPGTQGPRRVSRQEIERAFEHGWRIDSIAPRRFEIRPDAAPLGFSAGGPKAWFVMASRTPDPTR